MFDRSHMPGKSDLDRDKTWPRCVTGKVICEILTVVHLCLSVVYIRSSWRTGERATKMSRTKGKKDKVGDQDGTLPRNFIRYDSLLQHLKGQSGRNLTLKTTRKVRKSI